MLTVLVEHGPPLSNERGLKRLGIGCTWEPEISYRLINAGNKMSSCTLPSLIGRINGRGVAVCNPTQLSLFALNKS